MKRLLVFTLLFLSFWAQGQLTPNSPKAKIRVESVELCPGQTADVAVYVDFGEYATQKGVRAMENFMFFLYLSDTTVCEVVSSYKRNSYNYWVCEPVLKDMNPNIKCCMQNSYLYGTGWESAQDKVYTSQYPKAARFASTWFANESQAFMLTDSVPLFRIRIRCKREGICRLDFCHWSQMAFSTGPSYFGGEYFDFREGITNGIVDALPGKGPDPELVDAGRDSLLCVGARLTLNGEGGSDYKWTEISGKASQQSQFLVGSKTKNPTFTPKQAGEYRFQMAAFSPNGCYTFDTVTYTVGANHITDASLSPEWDFIDPGSSPMFTVTGQTVASAYPLTVTFLPDSLFAEGQNVFEMTPGGEPVYITSMPMTEPNLVAATIEDKYGCRKELASSVFVKGRNITGHLNPFPVYRCGNDNSDKSIQLNVLTRGGSGKFNYKWSVTSLESNVAAPVIDDPFARAPRLNYQGLCAVSVSIYDLVTGENVLISDTMIYRDWLHPSVEVVVDTLASGLVPGQPVGPFCEGRELAFKLQTVYAGEEPVYQWRINGITQENATGGTFSAVLDHDDYVDVIMHSDEECVAENTVQSVPFEINVRYPVYMSANVVNSGSTGEPYLDACYDSVKYRVLTWNTGQDYTITWLRNEKDVIYTGRVHSDNEEHSETDVVLPRMGFYDRYSCAISNTSMPCAVFDSITTESAYLNPAYTANTKPAPRIYNTQLPAELAPIQTMFANQLACENAPITVTTDIRYLPRDFTMIWFKKPVGGGDSVFLGYYRYDPKDENNSFGNVDNGFEPQEISDRNYWNADYDLVKILGYKSTVTNSHISNSNSAMAKIRTVVEEGFKLVLNDPSLKVDDITPCEQLNEGFEKGDTLYYVLYTPGNECGTGLRRYRSEDFVPNLIEYNDYSSMPLELAKLGSKQNCPTAPMVVVASVPNLPDDIKPLVHYEWRYDGRYETDGNYYQNPLLESDLFPTFSVLGAQKDTLYVTNSPADVKVTCRAIFEFTCGEWGNNKFKSFDFGDYVSVKLPDFTLVHTEDDTIVCAGSEITLWARADEKNVKYKNKRKAARAAAEYEYAWGADWASMPKKETAVIDHDTVVGMFNSSRRAITPAPAVVPQGYWEAWNETDGITTYYLSVHHRSSDCWAYDSVRVLSLPDKNWNVSLEPTITDMWCDSAKTGAKAQKIYLKSDDDPEVIFAWYLNGKRQFNWTGDTICVAGFLMSDTLSARVYTDLLTCRPMDKTVKLGVPYHESPAEVLTLTTPEWARVGEKVLLEAGAVIRGKEGIHVNDYLHNVTYRWQKQERNGSWTEVPASSHGISDPTYNIDSTSAMVPEGYTPRYRAIAEGVHHLCPADTGYVEVPVMVSVGVSLDVVEIKSDSKDGQPIFGMCSQSDDYVKVTGVSGNTGTIKDTLFDVAAGNKVRVRVAPQNPSAEAWVMYYRSGRPVAAGPVGSVRPNPRLPKPGTASYEILDNGEYCDMKLGEMDEVYVMYGTDTVSADGLNTHYSNKYVMFRLEPNGVLELVSDNQVVCPGGEVDLRVYFEDSVDTYGHIDKSQILTWEPAEALEGTPTGWTAKGTPSEETVYKATAVDGMHCPWTDSLRIYLMQEGEAFSVPFRMASPDSIFCDGEVRTGLQAYIPDDNKGLSSIFSEVTYYVCDASGAVQASVKGLDSVQLPIAVQDGWKAYASAKLKAACNSSLSYSDTLTFRAVARPVIGRISPRSKDTAICASNALVMNYAQPEGAGFAWHSVLAPMWGSDADLERAYRVDRNTEVVFEAYCKRLPSCCNFDTVFVEMLSGGVSGRPSLSLSASAEISCGENDAVTYTLEKRNCDTIIWYVNGVEAARNVLSFTFVPRYSGLTGDPDTVQVYGSRVVSVCDDGNEPIFVWSNSIITRRVGKPLFTYITPDTAVEKNTVLNLQASAMVGDGAGASFLWIKGEDEVVGRASVCPQVISEPAVFRVWAYQDAVYDLSEKCFSEAMVNVSVIGEGGDTVGPLPLLPALSLTPSATWLCGEDSVLYTLASVAGYDTLVWFENGLEIARNVWQLRRTPAYTGFDRADTVFVKGIAVDSLTADRDTIRYRISNIATVHRIEKPVFVKVSPRDTLVADGAEVLLSALATAPDGPQIVYFWIDSLEEEWSEEATFRIYPEKSQHYYVYAEQYRLETFECYAEDSVWVRVKTDTVAPIKMGEMEVYIPNTVIPYSQKKENKILRVYGLNIKSVHLQVFNDRSEKVYEGEGDSENTYWDVTGADGKVAPEGTYSYRATVTVLDEQGNEHIVNKQSWVQVIW